MLITVAGIPPGSAGDKDALEKFFRTVRLSTAQSSETALGVTLYELVALQDDESKPLYKTTKPHICYLTAAFSAVMRRYRLTSECIKFSDCDEPQTWFADDLGLNKSLHNLYKGLVENADTDYTLDTRISNGFCQRVLLL